MESFRDSNCHSMSDSFSLYERYMRSFNVGNTFVDLSSNHVPCEPEYLTNCESDNSNTRGNIELSTVKSNDINKHCGTAETESGLLRCDQILVDKGSSTDLDFSAKVDSPCTPLVASLLDNSSTTVDRSDLLISSEESRFDDFKHPVFITPTMENSSNAVDSGPMFREVGPSETIFKLPISELSFNGTLKHVQKLKPIVDPITALCVSAGFVSTEDKTNDDCAGLDKCNENIHNVEDRKCSDIKVNKMLDNVCDTVEKVSNSTGDVTSEESNSKKYQFTNDDGSTAKWNIDQSYSSLEASFDSGVRSPDMFSDIDEDDTEEPFWHFLKEYEVHDKRKVRKMEEILQGILPPPSVTILKTDVSEMLKKYYSNLPLFNQETKVNSNIIEENSMTPTKRVSFIEIPEYIKQVKANVEEPKNVDKTNCTVNAHNVSSELDTSANDKSIHLKMFTEIEAKEMSWPDIVKCRHYDVLYNVTKYSERFELLMLKYGERFVGAETDTSVNIYSGGMQSPSSASKRKALRLKMAQAKSPGRRLSHLARRRQAFCSAATISEKAHASNSKMVLIDKNFFPHRKLINLSERRSPRTRRTPGKKTPTRKTPGKKTPAKTPKTRSGGSSKKKAMRRLLMDSEMITRSQPSRETLKRALFISPEHTKPPQAATSVPAAMKSRRALFGSNVTADTKSMDGTRSDHFMKRKRDSFDDALESRSKIAKSLSFGGDTLGSTESLSFGRRASDMFGIKKSSDVERHKQKLLWAVTEALRAHGWRMSAPGFREKAEALSRLTRKLLLLPQHAARLAAPTLSTSDTMLKVARQYVFAIIQGRSIDECYQEEQIRLAKEASNKVSGYISAQAYQQMKTRQSTSTSTSQIKENTCNDLIKQEQTRSTSKNILQDKLVNIDSNSNSSSGLSMLDKSSLGLFKSNSMPSFEETAKMRARRQISFDNVDFPKR